MSQRVNFTCKFKPLGGDIAKASFKRAIEYVELDPKPGDLAMDRLKNR